MGSSTSHPNEEKCGASSKTQMIWGKKITNEKTLKIFFLNYSNILLPEYLGQ